MLARALGQARATIGYLVNNIWPCHLYPDLIATQTGIGCQSVAIPKTHILVTLV